MLRLLPSQNAQAFMAGLTVVRREMETARIDLAKTRLHTRTLLAQSAALRPLCATGVFIRPKPG